MADYELVEERLISGRGILRVPQQTRPIRHYILYLDVIREPSQAYLNLNYTPGRSRYCTAVFERSNYVVAQAAQEFKRQLFENTTDITGQNLIAIKCAYQGILETFVNLAQAIPVIFPTTLTNLIKDYESLDLFWDAVKITCYADTAIQARLFKLEYDRCDAEFDKRKRPPPPPPPLPPVPPGTGIGDIDDPYDEDDDTTDPHPIDDNFVPPPFGTECAPYRVRILAGTNSQPNLTTDVDVWGPIGEVRITPDQGSNRFVSLECRNRRSLGPCANFPFDWYGMFSRGADVTNGPTIISITPQ
jgi:hypothetical protein